MHLVMFDIDGTLTQTQRVDEACFVRALGDALGVYGIDTDWSKYPNCTDSGILETIFYQRRGRSPVPEEIAAMQRQFQALLIEQCEASPFQEVPGARSFVRHLLADPGTPVALASGGWECSARIKLASAGFEVKKLPAAFADAAHDREAIMMESLACAMRYWNNGNFQSVTYIGDGVWDVRAAKALGFRFIGLAADTVQACRLRDAGAEHVFPDFRDANPLLSLILPERF